MANLVMIPVVQLAQELIEDDYNENHLEYDYYVEKCEAANKRPLSFYEWLNG